MNLIPDEFEIRDPPIKHKNMKIIVPSKDFEKVMPELLKLLIMFMIISLKFILFKE